MEVTSQKVLRKNKNFVFKKIKAIFFVVFGFIFFTAQIANAADLFFSPSSGSYSTGKFFSVNVLVSSPDQAMNAASGAISFDATKLEVTSLSKDGSIISLWVGEPSYSNTAGSINFEGIVLNPGFTGSSGKLLTINFKAKDAGAAKVAFSSGSILANDGLGTSILNKMGSASFSLELSQNTTEETAVQDSKPQEEPTLYDVLPSGLLAEPKISSETHPDQNSWYAATTASFSWPIPNGATSMRISYSENRDSVPTVNYTPPISSKTIENLTDGTYYFHARFKNSLGWGDTAHFKFQIDTQKPSFLKITEDKREDETDPKVRFIFEAQDEGSGIDLYEVKIDNEDTIKLNYEENKVFEAPPLSYGRHTMVVKAIDRAQNYLAEVVEFNISSLSIPQITYYPKRLDIGEPLLIQGKALPSTTAVITFQNQKGEEKNKKTLVDENGNFVLVYDEELPTGVYTFWVHLEDNKGAVSPNTDKLSFIIEPLIIIRIGAKINKLLAILIPFAAMVFLLVKGFLFVWNKSGKAQKIIKQDLKKAEQVVAKDIKIAKGIAKKDVETAQKVLNNFLDEPRATLSKAIKDVESLAKKGILAKEERHVLQSLKHGLRKIERGIDKEIKKIK